jgi:exopolysaccharide biosynthesis protein
MAKPETQGGLACLSALNLDGGSSSQLYASMDDFVIDIPGFSRVADAIVVRPR